MGTSNKEINMKKMWVMVLVLAITGSASIMGQSGKKSKLKYQDRSPRGKVFQDIRQKQKAIEAKKDLETKKIKERQEKEKRRKKQLKAIPENVFPPSSPGTFSSVFHFPPEPQHSTGTCWSFATTSYFESEIFRITGEKINLSKMWAPYFELLEKSRQYIRERGEFEVGSGGQSNGLIRIWKQYGVVPIDVYNGLKPGNEIHNHWPMMKEISRYLEYVKEKNLWNEEENLEHITLILNRYMGEPPTGFTYKGKEITPMEFLKNETGLNLDDYYSLMSTSYFPFYTMDEYMVPDNWWHSREYINLPLNEWYQIIKKSIKAGYSVGIGGDVSEPGILAEKDILFVPSFDIPQNFIDQDAREFRFSNESSTDDHLVHIVGYKRHKGRDWFLYKDSGSGARRGKHIGYYMMRDDYLRLKILVYVVHKDMIKNILPRIKTSD